MPEQPHVATLPCPIEALPLSDIYTALETRSQGLTQAEAAARLQHYGRNTIQTVETTSLVRKFLANFTHLMALLLWVGGLLGFLAQMPQLGIAIWLVNLINGAFSFWQEYQAEQATAALRHVLPTYARVVRDGQEQRLLAEELVPGDVMLLAEGDHISADGRLDAATAMTLAAVVATQIGNLFAQRTGSLSVLRMRWGRNPLVWVGIATDLVLMVLLLYVPVLQRLFGTAPLPPQYWLFLCAWMPIVLLAVEVELPHLLAGRTVNELTLLGEIHVVAMSREGRTFLPTLGTVFREGDRVHLAVLGSSSARLTALLGEA
jgi:magnesium-transporting ATPase (P-type)